MRSSEKTRLVCPICRKHTSSKNLLKVSKEFSYKVCNYCGGARLYPEPSKKQLAKIYQSKSYYGFLSQPVFNNFVQWILTRKIYSTPADFVKKNFQRGRVLDVGCGNGEFLEELNKSNWETYGSDISAIAALNTSKKIGKNKVKIGSFVRQQFKNIDLVSFWHVLEHTNNPASYVTHAKDLLSKGGYIVGEVPNFDSISLQLFSKHYSWLMIPEHYLYFSNKALKLLLHTSGFKSIRVYSSPRALLNFSLSFKKFLNSQKIPALISQVLFIISVPLSIIITVTASSLGKGEVLRFIAK